MKLKSDERYPRTTRQFSAIIITNFGIIIRSPAEKEKINLPVLGQCENDRLALASRAVVKPRG
jgi:hypothetical protein